MLSIHSTSAQERVRFTSVATGQRLDGNMNGDIYPHAPHEGYWQKWFLKKAGSDNKGTYYYIRNSKTEKYLGVAIFGNAGVVGYDESVLNNSDAKKLAQWYINDEGAGIVTISSRLLGRRLDGNNEAIYSHEPNTGPYQRWRMTNWQLDEGPAKELKWFPIQIW